MIRTRSMLKVFLGSFFLQSSWSFEKMQGLGFAAAISPAIKDVFNGGGTFISAMRRHLTFYNAHPYMASLVLGASIRLEEKGKNGECPAGAGARLKTIVMGPYGALGDSFYWGSVRPLASCLGALSAILWGLWGILIFLAVYNVFHLWMRWEGLAKGYRLGEGVVGYVKSLELPKWSIRLRYIAAAVLGVFFAIASFDLAQRGVMALHLKYRYPWVSAGIMLAFAAVVSLNIFLKRGVTVARLIYVAVVPLIILGVIFR
jgi:mannose PTS system EIID component